MILSVSPALTLVAEQKPSIRGDRHNSTGSLAVMSVLVSNQSRVPGLAFSLRMGLSADCAEPVEWAGAVAIPSTPADNTRPAAAVLFRTSRRLKPDFRSLHGSTGSGGVESCIPHCCHRSGILTKQIPDKQANRPQISRITRIVNRRQQRKQRPDSEKLSFSPFPQFPHVQHRLARNSTRQLGMILQGRQMAGIGDVIEFRPSIQYSLTILSSDNAGNSRNSDRLPVRSFPWLLTRRVDQQRKHALRARVTPT